MSSRNFFIENSYQVLTMPKSQKKGQNITRQEFLTLLAMD